MYTCIVSNVDLYCNEYTLDSIHYAALILYIRVFGISFIFMNNRIGYVDFSWKVEASNIL